MVSFGLFCSLILLLIVAVLECVPTSTGNESGNGLEPQMLISLTAPKVCAKYFTGTGKSHYVGGRFVPMSLAEEFNLELPGYSGVEQCMKLPVPY
ncbi:hypothetical protein DD238_002397 [Peronospora effusa]|uniref:Uncharacterized protein n=1 Tax=Peronospora effusa TaxID=542832 RepID=A0A3M6VKB0_9STRA|nr:hypothetical protein DD238_002397 [Peronospora effusa]